MFKMRESASAKCSQRKPFNNQHSTPNIHFVRALSSSPFHLFPVAPATRAKGMANPIFHLQNITLRCKVEPMEPDRAAEHLEVIRTLMERSAVYRRALAPVMTLAGTLGTAAAAAGWFLHFETPIIFTGFWLCVGILTALSAFLLIRQQALKQKEDFLTPPTRRIVHALLPALLIGLVLGIVIVAIELKKPVSSRSIVDAGIDLTWLPLIWIVLYGCALHAAGFFTPRGLRLFGWAFVLGGCTLFIYWALIGFDSVRPQRNGHVLMGVFFGVLHLAYGTYLSVTERKNAA